jgi:hypothetical protein
MPRGLSDYDSARIQGRLWTPEVLRPDAWFDASDISTISVSATGISEWRDKSGNARHMSRADTTWRPIFEAEKKNGLSFVNFATGTPSPNDQLYRLQMASSINVRSAYCALSRKNTLISSASNFVFTSSGGSGSGNYDWHAPTTSANPAALADGSNSSGSWRGGSNFRNGNSITITAAGSGPLDEWSVYSFLCTGNMVTQGIGWDRLYHPSVGDYGEVCWFSAAHTARERLVIEGYLSWKWAIPLAAAHPFANRPPLIGD